MTIEIKAIDFDNTSEAIQHTEASRHGEAIRLDGRNLVIDQGDADRIAAAGVEFAYLCDHELPDGSHRIVTIPVNG